MELSLVEGSPPTTPATATEDGEFVYGQDIEVETSLDTELPLEVLADDATDNTLEKKVLAAVVAEEEKVIEFYYFFGQMFGSVQVSPMMMIVIVMHQQ